MATEIVTVSGARLLWLNVAVLLMVVGCTVTQPECSARVDQDLLAQVEQSVFTLFEDDLGRERAENRFLSYEIRDLQTCGNRLAFSFWPKPEVVGTVYHMEYDITTGEVEVTGID